MKNIVLLLLISFIALSCQKEESKKKNWPVAIEAKSGNHNSDSISEKKERTDVIIKLPQDRYAVITLELYTTNDYDQGEETFYKPIGVKVFDNKTKKEIPEILLPGIYYSDNNGDNEDIWYGDFNFDGKMDIACEGRYIGYREFYSQIFYLATTKGYEYRKDFSEITDDPIAYIKLDAKKKTITAYREAEYNESTEYIVKNNKLEVGRYTKDADRHGPFYYHYDSDAAIQERTILSYNDDFLVVSFKTKDIRKNIILFLYDEYETNNFNLHYAEMINDSLVDSSYSDKFIYNQKNGTLSFGDNSTKYKLYDNEVDFGIEITEKGKTIKLIGDTNTKKGNLSRILSLKRDEEEKKDREYENVSIEK